MWEQIRKNQRRSLFLIVLLGAILIAAGGVIGAAILVWAGAPFQDWTDLIVLSRWGVLAGAVIWFVLTLTAFTAGESLLLSGVGAREMSHKQAPRLANIVEEMSIAAGLPQPPRLFLIDSNQPNAFAVGRNPRTAAVVITSGLARRLTRDELQGVIAHEIGHIKNFDVRFMTCAGVMVGSIVMLCDFFWRLVYYTSRGARYSRGRGRGGKGQGGAAAILFLAAALTAILAPLAARMLYLACSRKREYLADASAVVFTRYPAGLASALEKISGSADSSPAGGEISGGTRVTAPMFIVNPLQRASLTGLFATHPPIEKRIAILRNMAGAASYGEYESAFKQAMNGRGKCIGAQTLKSGAALPIRPPSPDSPDDMLERGREALDFLGRSAGGLVIACSCGMRITLPPKYGAEKISCPRCGRPHSTNEALVATAASAGMGATGTMPLAGGAPLRVDAVELQRILAGQQPAPSPPRGKTAAANAEPVVYKRRTPGAWETVQCDCGHSMQLSPSFRAGRLTCRKCGRKIAVAEKE